MLPVIWTIPGINLDIPGYGLMLMIALLGPIMWGANRAAKSGANPDVILNCGFIAVFAGVIGGRSMYVIHYWSQFANLGGPANTFWAVVDITKGGLEVYGGVLLASFVTLSYLYFWKHSIRWYMDIIAPSAALGMAIGRIGCYLNGCCWGGVCDMPWAVQFPYGSPPQVHYSVGPPKQELPKELIFEVPGHRPEALTREQVFAPIADLEAAKSVVIGKDAQISQMISQIASAKKAANTPEVQRLAKEFQELIGADKVRLLQRKSAISLLTPSADYTPIAINLVKYNLTPQGLRDIAANYHSPKLHPAQLYSTIGLTLLALALSALYYRRSHDGYVIAVFLMVEPLVRYTLEFIRTDNPKDTAGGLMTVSQFIAASLFATGLITFLVCRALPARSPLAKIWIPEEESGKDAASKQAKAAAGH